MYVLGKLGLRQVRLPSVCWGTSLAALTVGWAAMAWCQPAPADDSLSAEGKVTAGAHQERQDAVADFVRDVAPLLDTYCVTCHADADADETPTFAFATASDVAETLRVNRVLFEKMSLHLKAKRMPPPDHPQPDPDERLLLIDWLDHDVLAIDCSVRQDPGRVTAD